MQSVLIFRGLQVQQIQILQRWQGKYRGEFFPYYFTFTNGHITFNGQKDHDSAEEAFKDCHGRHFATVYAGYDDLGLNSEDLARHFVNLHNLQPKLIRAVKNMMLNLDGLSRSLMGNEKAQEKLAPTIEHFRKECKEIFDSF